MNGHILFPTDFSKAAEQAFQYALKLAEELGTQVDLMSVYHLPVSDASRVAPYKVDEMLREGRGKVMEQLSDFAEAAAAKRIGQLRVDYGLFVYQEIVDVARKEGHQLIVMGTKGERNALERLLGSVTTHTMMNAPCPVLAVPMGAEFRPIKHIAYATDFEPSDEQVVAQLNDFGKRLGAKVHFLHVDRENKYGTAEKYVMVEDYPMPFTDFSVINDPSPTQAIETFVKEHRIDLLALFLPNRRFWERVMHHSFTKKMTFHSKVPVLVFRE